MRLLDKPDTGRIIDMWEMLARYDTDCVKCGAAIKAGNVFGLGLTDKSINVFYCAPCWGQRNDTNGRI